MNDVLAFLAQNELHILVGLAFLILLTIARVSRNLQGRHIGTTLQGQFEELQRRFEALTMLMDSNLVETKKQHEKLAATISFGLEDLNEQIAKMIPSGRKEKADKDSPREEKRLSL
jgi:hypothetical protein